MLVSVGNNQSNLSSKSCVTEGTVVVSFSLLLEFSSLILACLPLEYLLVCSQLLLASPAVALLVFYQNARAGGKVSLR